MRNTATARTESSISCREPVSSVTTRRNSSPLSAIGIKRTISSISAGTRKRFAYYASLNGNRSNYGLQTPIGQVFHDAENGYGGFASFIYNPSSTNQFRLVTSLRQDYYQIPNDPDPELGSEIRLYPSYGLRDSET